MIELVTEILIYLGIAALLGLVLGYLIWGWGMRGRIAAARAEGAASARTSVDGDTAMRERLEACMAERKRLDAEVARLTKDLEGQATETSKPAEPAAAEQKESAETETVPEDDATEETRDTDLTEDAVSEERDEIEESAEEVEPEESAQASPEPPAPPKSLLSERPEEVDDLKRIKGVGRVMEGILNDKGLYLFRQVANLTPEDVAWVNEAIDAFPGRIERDEWVAQAQTLFREKYGKAHDAPED